MTTPSDVKSEELSDFLQDLPQELYDKIYDEVFTAEPAERTVTSKYKPPVQIRVSRASRAQFARSYYGQGSTFRFEIAKRSNVFDKVEAARRLLQKWIRSVDASHVGDVQEVRIVLRGWGAHNVRTAKDRERGLLYMLGTSTKGSVRQAQWLPKMRLVHRCDGEGCVDE